MTQKTFIMVKPDHIGLADRILEELDLHGHREITSRVLAVPRDGIGSHYVHHIGKPYFGYMTESFIGDARS